MSFLFDSPQQAQYARPRGEYAPAESCEPPVATRDQRRTFPTSRYRDIEDRLLARSVVIPHGHKHAYCWMWMGRVEKNGYAKIGVYEGGGRENERVRNYWVHRVAYETFHCAAIPDGFDVDHICRFPLCINPKHLRAIPAKKNRSMGARNGNAKRRGK